MQAYHRFPFGYTGFALLIRPIVTQHSSCFNVLINCIATDPSQKVLTKTHHNHELHFPSSILMHYIDDEHLFICVVSVVFSPS